MRAMTRASGCLSVFCLAAALPTVPALAFPAPVTPSFPADLDAETITVDYTNTQTFVRNLKQDFDFNPFPEVHWFKYVADGQSEVYFDTLGTNVSSLGPHLGYTDGNYASLGFGTYDQTQIAVYDAQGNLVGQNGYWLDDNGDSVLKYNPTLYQQYYPNGDPELPLNAGFVEDPVIFITGTGAEVDFSEVASQGLTNLNFVGNAPDNPHWSADPNDPTVADPSYQPPHPGAGKNAYELWDTALTDAVIIENNDQPYARRAFDRNAYGPGRPWHQYDALPAGEYFVAVSSSAPAFAGDVEAEEVLQTPIWFDDDTQTDMVPKLTEDMDPYQYYMDVETPSFPRQYGYIVLNVRHAELQAGIEGDYNDSGQVEQADLDLVLQNWGLDTGAFPIPTGWTNDLPDGLIDQAELDGVLLNWGSTSAPQFSGAAVPEPAGAFGVLLLAAAGARHRNRSVRPLLSRRR